MGLLDQGEALAREIQSRVIREMQRRKINEFHKLGMECVVTPTFLTRAIFTRAIRTTSSNWAAKEWE